MGHATTDLKMNRYRRKPRPTPIEQEEEDEGRRSMSDLVHYLWEKNELNKPYNLFKENCKLFAKRIFDEIASQKYL